MSQETIQYPRPPITEAVIELRFEDTVGQRELERLRDRFKSQFGTVEELQTIEVSIKGTKVNQKSDPAGYKMTAKKRETESVEDIEILAPQSGLPSEERFALEKASLSLPKEDREIITLKYLDGLSYDELAEHLQIPKGTVMSRLFHARRQLHAKLTGKFH